MAGEGKRLQPYTLDRPKCMVEINEISLIDRQIAVLEKEKIAEKKYDVNKVNQQMLREMELK